MTRAVARSQSAMERAAEAGDLLSQVNLAVMHDNRRLLAGAPGLSQNVASAALNDQQALKWWARAANQGSAKAQASLARRYETGDGVAQDLVGALTWYLLAAPRLRGDEAERALATQRSLARRMPADDVRRAERRARAWAPQPEAAVEATG